MPKVVRTKQKVEFGDFQTPLVLARQVCDVLRSLLPAPAAVLEPTCGRGNFLAAALDAFPPVQRAVGFDVNAAYVEAARLSLARQSHRAACDVVEQDFFLADWSAILKDLPEPLLIVGNPPWVTNSALGIIAGSNLPVKANHHGRKGLDALTGKSNFDISEWMLTRLLDSVGSKRALIAMLCKTGVARKVLRHAWTHGLISRAAIRVIDAKEHFDASVDACLLVCDVRGPNGLTEADVFPRLMADQPSHRIGFRDERLVSDVQAYERTLHFAGNGPFRWRSGIKHDCASIMEFSRVGNRLRNGLGELVELDEEFLYPALKSSDVARGAAEAPSRWMLVTQQSVGEDTRRLQRDAPRVWHYLNRHAERLDRRASSIYRGRPRFSMFGVGPYAFSPHKVAVSCLYKRLSFAVVDSYAGRPVVLNDTCAFIPCRSADEAAFVAQLLESEAAQSFYRARIFWDAKRPITTEALNQLDLCELARVIEPDHPVAATWADEKCPRDAAQLQLF